MTDIPTVVAHVTHLERGADAIRLADQFATRARGGRLYVTHVVPAMPDAMRDILFPSRHAPRAELATLGRLVVCARKCTLRG